MQQYFLLFLTTIASIDAKIYECIFTKLLSNDANKTNEFSVSCELFNVNFHENKRFILSLNVKALENAAGTGEDYFEEDNIKEIVKELKFTSSKLSFVPNSVFETFGQLQVFNADNCELKSIHPNSFKNTGNLIKIFLQNNRIKQIISYGFVDAKNLKLLDLSNNEIVKVLSNAFAGLESLENLFLSNNKISYFDDEIFANLENLVNIELNNNQLTMIVSNLFTKVHKKLSTISLNFNEINEISPHVFDSLESLKILLLSGNKCVDISFSDRVIQENTSIKMELIECFKNYRKNFPMDDDKFNVTRVLHRLKASNEICKYEFDSVNESMSNLRKQLEQLLRT